MYFAEERLHFDESVFENISEEEEDEKEIKKREQQEKKEKRKREREEKRKEAAEKKKKTGLRTGRLSKCFCHKYMVVTLAFMTFSRQYTHTFLIVQTCNFSAKNSKAGSL